MQPQQSRKTQHTNCGHALTVRPKGYRKKEAKRKGSSAKLWLSIFGLFSCRLKVVVVAVVVAGCACAKVNFTSNELERYRCSNSPPSTARVSVAAACACGQLAGVKVFY